ncbi:Putative 4,5-dihydroxyphthalate dehydrogenase [Paenibacillus konkukensis]|uniref:4,5-dihydroxyphthalate dehydrogenase n=1 Tax=Paenibacillus konkukensis TaxID=2020716 RepID=A0ABY4RFJ8_9BACL|nr:Gfo/Idh/MocA family oxidoreductase [Paenibacillus konkukensis]UQZ81153.1 Putative 4,5-dihydroxyphthalate dehydrogenase [Paenibacillus konkukensis]
MKKTLYRVAISGLGNRGWSHLAGFAAHADRFQVSAVCSSSADKLRIVKSRFEDCLTYSDTEKMLAEVRPDVFCFATPPSVRLSYVRLAARYGVKAIAMEKPIAGSLQEAREISRICSEHGIQVVVCHQHKYLPSFVRLKQFVQSGDIGEIVRIHGKTRGWLYNSGTHFVDYLLWINGGVKADWVVGHVHGKGKLEDSHPSPEYALGELHFGNGVTGIIECGYLSPPYLSEDRFWTDNRLTVHGTHGYAWAETDGRWGPSPDIRRDKCWKGRRRPGRRRSRTPFRRITRKIWPTGWMTAASSTRAISTSASTDTKYCTPFAPAPSTTPASICRFRAGCTGTSSDAWSRSFPTSPQNIRTVEH